MFSEIFGWLVKTCFPNPVHAIPSQSQKTWSVHDSYLNLPFLLFTQQTTQRRQYLQIRHSQDTPKQAQDKWLGKEEKKVIISFATFFFFSYTKHQVVVAFQDDFSCTIIMPPLYSLLAVICTAKYDISQSLNIMFRNWRSFYIILHAF